MVSSRDNSRALQRISRRDFARGCAPHINAASVAPVPLKLRTMTNSSYGQGVVHSGRSILRVLRDRSCALPMFRLARPEAETGARSPPLDGRDMAGAATVAFFRRSEGPFLIGHFLTAVVASPAIERWAPRMLRLRLMDLNGARHGALLIHDARWALVVLTRQVGAHSRTSSR
jgi:hypothetical protein